MIPNLKALLARRANNPNNFEAGLKFYLARNPNSPIKSREDIANSPELARRLSAHQSGPVEAPAAPARCRAISTTSRPVRN